MDESQANKACRLRIVTGVAILLVVMAAELALSVRQQSQTFDEACHTFAGYRYWKNSDFGINFEHPPLVKLVAALPLLWLPLRVPTLSNSGDFKLVEYAAGREFLYSNDANWVLWRARMAVSLFTIALGLAVFLVAYSMFGVAPALLALILVVFEPNILAHGALVTTDIGVTLGLFLGVGSFYLYVKKPSNLRLASAGLAAGLCLGAKHSGILIFPMLFLLALAELLNVRDSTGGKPISDRLIKVGRQAASLTAITAISLAVLWSLYGFRYTARAAGASMSPPLAQFATRLGPNASAAVLTMARWHLLPESYLYGVVNVYSLGNLPTIIFGRYYPRAQWFYFPAVFIIKSTVAFLLLCVLAPLAVGVWIKQFRREALFLLVPIGCYFAVGMLSGVNYGVRHLLPVYPFLILVVAFGAWNLGRRHRTLAALVVGLVTFHVASSVRAFPNYIPYANELWGGPENIHRVLADSNVDWGQGLVAMKRYIDERHIKNCWFGYFGSIPVDASYYGIPCKALPTSFADSIHLLTPAVPPQVDGPVFISSTEVSGTYWQDWINPYLPFQRMPPSALIADSILVYDGKVDLSQAAALGHENLAMRLVSAQRFDQALAESQTAAEVAPSRPAPHVTRSIILAAMGRKAEADEEIARAGRIADAVVAAR